MAATRGRKTKLTPAVRKRIEKAVRDGNYLNVAASLGGIHPATLFAWLKRGEEARSGLYREFRDAIVSARHEAEARNIAVIQKAAQGYPVKRTVRKTDADGKVVEEVTTTREFDWRASAWYLERSFPKKYGKRDHLTHAGDKDAPAVFTLEIAPPPGAAGDDTADA